MARNHDIDKRREQTLSNSYEGWAIDSIGNKKLSCERLWPYLNTTSHYKLPARYNSPLGEAGGSDRVVPEFSLGRGTSLGGLVDRFDFERIFRRDFEGEVLGIEAFQVELELDLPAAVRILYHRGILPSELRPRKGREINFQPVIIRLLVPSF